MSSEIMYNMPKVAPILVELTLPILSYGDNSTLCMKVGIFFVGPCEGPTMKCVCAPPTHHHHPPTTLSSEIKSCTSDSPTPSNPYIFWKLMSRAIQRRQRDTNTKTMTITNTKTKTKTKTRTPRQYLEHLQCAIFSESWWLAQSSPALPRTV